MSKEVKRYFTDCNRLRAGDQPRDECDVRVVLASDYDALLAERDALAKDAERYRWLRQRLVGASFDWDDEGTVVLAFEMPAGLSIGADCDKNIDNALQGEQP